MATDTDPLYLDKYLPFMRDVVRCEQSLHELNLTWRTIESAAKMNCREEAEAILPTMASTRAHFNRLEQELVSGLVNEKLMTVVDEIGTKAQYVIDIVVRNLYERTADVGFLATDNALCSFLAGLDDDRNAIRNRLLAYRATYTVYDEIMLLDTEGNVVVQLDGQALVASSRDPLVQQTLESTGYVETFRHTDLRPARRQALIYSRRMHHPATGAVIGLLCLCFNFEQEMAGIFASHRDPAGRYNMLLLDETNRCIESADRIWIPIDAKVPVNREATADLFMCGGRQYLIRTFAAHGYQGYMGPPGWQGQVIIPIETAFTASDTRAVLALDADMADGLLSHAQDFCPPLHEIVTAAETIRRVVWNGQVMTAGRSRDIKLKAILEQISETGARSNELFARSIRDLYRTVLVSSMRDAEFIARLLVDVLDRNLYERSNDCRWWALTPELREALATRESDAGTLERIGAILQYINGLYTVYTRLFVYDRSGTIIACSDRDGSAANMIGTAIDQDALQRVLGLRTDQEYVVSPFENTGLYGGAPTYVYHAAIHEPGKSGSVVGGIGIVFDAAPEFGAMLRDGLADKRNSSAFFVDRHGKILSSTDPARTVGSLLELDAGLLALPNGSATSRVVIRDGRYAIMGCTVSSGYREFKVSDGYRDDVIAVVFESFGAVREGKASRHADTRIENSHGDLQGREFATFLVDGLLFALDVGHVLEARPAEEIFGASMVGPARSIGMLRLHAGMEAEEFIWVFDLGLMLRATPTFIDSRSQVVVVKCAGRRIGLLVGELHAVAVFENGQVKQSPLAGESRLVKGLVKANGGRLLLQLLDAEVLFDLLSHPGSEPLPARLPLDADAGAVLAPQYL